MEGLLGCGWLNVVAAEEGVGVEHPEEVSAAVTSSPDTQKKWITFEYGRFFPAFFDAFENFTRIAFYFAIPSCLISPNLSRFVRLCIVDVVRYICYTFQSSRGFQKFRFNNSLIFSKKLRGGRNCYLTFFST